jgi:hypothetical protein
MVTEPGSNVFGKATLLAVVVGIVLWFVPPNSPEGHWAILFLLVGPGTAGTATFLAHAAYRRTHARSVRLLVLGALTAYVIALGRWLAVTSADAVTHQICPSQEPDGCGLYAAQRAIPAIYFAGSIVLAVALGMLVAASHQHPMRARLGDTKRLKW